MALDFFAGCLGGFSGILVGHPFDTVKVRLQNQSLQSPKYKGTWNCFTEIIRKESKIGLYKGMLSPLYGQVAINAIVFGIHGNILRKLNNQGCWSQFLAGATAGGVQCIIASPMELVKIRFQMQGEGEIKLVNLSKRDARFHYSSPSDCIRKIYKYEGGFKGVFRGMGLTLWREMPSFGAYFSSYYYLCEKTNAVVDGVVSIPKLLLCGGCAGIFCWLITYPMDVIKTRHQMDGMGKTRYNGIIDCAIKSYREEGFNIYFRGLNATLLRAFPTNAATLATVTIFLNVFRLDE